MADGYIAIFKKYHQDDVWGRFLKWLEKKWRKKRKKKMQKEIYDQDIKKRHSKITFQKSGQYCWETPEEFFKELDKEFNFNLDACANEENHKCKNYFSESQDGLKQEWKGNVFMNPPYGTQISKWVKKAYEESGGGALVVCLLPARTDTSWWWNYCIKGEIRFIRGRLKFKGRNTKGEMVNYPATFPSAVIIFRPHER